MSDALDFASALAAIHSWVVAGSGLAADHVFWELYGKARPSAPYIALSWTSVRGVGHDWVTRALNNMTFPTQVISAVDASANTLTISGHPFATGDGPVRVASSGTLPAPLLAGTDYWVIVVGANTIKLAPTYVDTGGQQPLGAGNPTAPIDLTTTGTGTITLVGTADTTPAGREVARTAEGFREVVIGLQCFAKEGAGIDAVRILSNVIASLQLYTYALDQAGVGVSDFGQAYLQGGVQMVEGRRGSILEPRAKCDLTVYMASSVTGYDTTIESVDASIVLESEGDTPLPAIPVHIT